MCESRDETSAHYPSAALICSENGDKSQVVCSISIIFIFIVCAIDGLWRTNACCLFNPHILFIVKFDLFFWGVFFSICPLFEDGILGQFTCNNLTSDLTHYQYSTQLTFHTHQIKQSCSKCILRGNHVVSLTIITT